MRDLNGFVKKEINDANIKSLLFKWFIPRQKTQLNYNILSPSSRFLSVAEKSQLRVCSEFISGTRLQVNNEVYHSKSYRSMAKTCSFLIKYSEKNFFYYAFICYYLQLNENIFACIELIDTECNKWVRMFS